VKIVYFKVPEKICRERIKKRKDHPTLEEDKVSPAIAQYKARLEAPTLEECDEMIVRNQ
jgi:hypothetical protein